MAGQIAIFEGHRMPRKRKRRRLRGFGASGQQSRFTKIACKCSRMAKRGGSYQACMKRLLKKGGRRRKKR